MFSFHPAVQKINSLDAGNAWAKPRREKCVEFIRMFHSKRCARDSMVNLCLDSENNVRFQKKNQ